MTWVLSVDRTAPVRGGQALRERVCEEGSAASPGGVDRCSVESDEAARPMGGPLEAGLAQRTLLARGPLGLDSTSKTTGSPPTRRSKSSDASRPPRWKKYSFSSSA